MNLIQEEILFRIFYCLNIFGNCLLRALRIAVMVSMFILYKSSDIFVWFLGRRGHLLNKEIDAPQFERFVCSVDS